MRITCQIIVTTITMFAMFWAGNVILGDWIKEQDLLSSLWGGLLVCVPFAVAMTSIETLFENFWPLERND